ncbi:MAG: NUDIX domain-containing protein, partial [Nitrospinaceae bacterium]|nr:NUDIX domain-containing protein [Nitrospinaceae bacterium]
MRSSEGALAWITRDGAMGQEWLTRWNRKWNNRSLIGGHREDGESFRDCLVREILEETGIREGEDYVMSSEP